MKKAELYRNVLKEINLRNKTLHNGVKELTEVFEKYKKELEDIKNGDGKIKGSAS